MRFIEKLLCTEPRTHQSLKSLFAISRKLFDQYLIYIYNNSNARLIQRSKSCHTWDRLKNARVYEGKTNPLTIRREQKPGKTDYLRLRPWTTVSQDFSDVPQDNRFFKFDWFIHIYLIFPWLRGYEWFVNSWIERENLI